MSNFKIGEKVVCIESTVTQTKGNIYEIIWQHTFKCGTQIVQTDGHIYIGNYKTICHCGCEEILNYQRTFGCCGSENFRKLDHSFGEKICAEILESIKVKKEQLN